MRPKQIDMDFGNANLTGFASNITGAGPYTMTTTTTDDTPVSLAHQVSIRNDSITDYSGQTFTLTGTDADGRTQTEAVTGPVGSATVESAKYFKTLTTISASGAGIGADTFDVGWVDEIASQTIPLDFYALNPPTIQVDVTGTLNYDIEYTLQDVFKIGQAAPFDFADQEALTWVNDANWTARTTDLTDDLAITGIRAIRIVINSYTDTAELQFWMTQPKG